MKMVLMTPFPFFDKVLLKLVYVTVEGVTPCPKVYTFYDVVICKKIIKKNCVHRWFKIYIINIKQQRGI